MPNVTEIKNICVYLQANNYTAQLYLYTDQKNIANGKGKKAGERKKKRRRKGYNDVNLFNLC